VVRLSSLDRRTLGGHGKILNLAKYCSTRSSLHELQGSTLLRRDSRSTTRQPDKASHHRRARSGGDHSSVDTLAGREVPNAVEMESHPAEVVTAVQEILRPKPSPTPASTPCYTDSPGGQASG
jgi:hypothetical protein